MKNIILFGPPGSGKGHQSNILIKVFKMQLISPGNLFRVAVSQETDLGFKVKKILEQGELVPNDVTNGIIADHINNLVAKNYLLFDGYPRNINQAEFLTNILEKNNSKIDFVFDLWIDKSCLLERLRGRLVCSLCSTTYHNKFYPLKRADICDLCGGDVKRRSDDNAATIENRIKVYHEQTRPILDYYRSRTNVIKIDASLRGSAVFQSIYKIVAMT